MEHRMICLDNSEWMRNGDFAPTRMKAQRDAANIICTRHLSSNPENTVGIMTLAGPRCTIHATQCTDNPRLHRAIALDNTPIGGKCRVLNGIKIARLALKNRPNQKGEARIVLFVGSPLTEEKKALEKVGRDLKKNSCGISVVLMGEVGDNKEKMEALVAAARKEEGQRCDLIIVPPGVTPLEVVRNSPLCAAGVYGQGAAGGGDAPAAGAGAGAGGAGAGEDDIQRALRLSLLESQGAAAGGEGASAVPPAAMTEDEQIRRAIELSMLESAGGSAPAPAPAAGDDGNNAEGGDGEDDEDARLIQQALAMSAAEGGGDDDAAAEEEEEDGGDDDASMIAAALAASLAEGGDDEAAPATPAPAPAPAAEAAPALPDAGGFSDPDYVKTLLASIPGASIDDPLIQAALAEAKQIEKGKPDGEGGGEGGGKGGGKDGDKKK